MAKKEYFRESAGAVASPINLVTTEGNAADWVQAVAGGAMVLTDNGGSSVSIANAGAGQSFKGPFRAITSSAGKIRYGTGEPPSQSDTSNAGAAASATAAATSATSAATSATNAATSATTATTQASAASTSATAAATSATAAASSATGAATSATTATTQATNAATSATAAATSATNAAASAAAASYTYLDVTLITGTKTQASGANLGAARIVGAPRLKAVNGSTALGAQILSSISGNNVILTAKKPGDASTETGDEATYEVVISGAA